MYEWVWSIGEMILTGENWSTGREILYSVGGRGMNEYGALVEWYWQGKTEVLGEKYYTALVVDVWMSMEQWWDGTDRGNWSTGRQTLYSVGSRWMNEYGALVEWYWQGETEVLAEKPVPVPLNDLGSKVTAWATARPRRPEIHPQWPQRPYAYACLPHVTTLTAISDRHSTGPHLVPITLLVWTRLRRGLLLSWERSRGNSYRATWHYADTLQNVLTSAVDVGPDVAWPPLSPDFSNTW
jgi:hypothetical protein